MMHLMMTITVHTSGNDGNDDDHDDDDDDDVRWRKIMHVAPFFRSRLLGLLHVEDTRLYGHH